MSTAETLLIAGGVAVVGYMLLKSKTTATQPTTIYVPVNSGSSNQTANDITAAGGALSSIFGSLFGT